MRRVGRGNLNRARPVEVVAPFRALTTLVFRGLFGSRPVFVLSQARTRCLRRETTSSCTVGTYHGHKPPAKENKGGQQFTTSRLA